LLAISIKSFGTEIADSFLHDVDQKPHPSTHECSSVGARPSSAAPIGQDRLSKRYETAIQPKSP